MFTPSDPTINPPWKPLPSTPHWQTKRNVLYPPPHKPANTLQTLNLYRPTPPTPISTPTPAPRIWIVYIHGGAWRDPHITSSAIEATLPHLPLKTLSGLASLSYSLSPHPSHPNPTHDPSRLAKHPAHLRDVLAGLHWLLRNVIEDAEYVLCGHSCGATLALQAVFGAVSLTEGRRVNGGIGLLQGENLSRPPRMVVGVAGLYDLPGLLSAPGEGHGELVPVYREILEGAFGCEEGVWGEVSPVGFDLRGEGVEGTGVVVLAQSPDDQLVSEVQREGMVRVLRAAGWREEVGQGRGKRLVLEETEGKHDDVWKGGVGLAGLLRRAVEMIVEERG